MVNWNKILNCIKPEEDDDDVKVFDGLIDLFSTPGSRRVTCNICGNTLSDIYSLKKHQALKHSGMYGILTSVTGTFYSFASR